MTGAVIPHGLPERLPEGERLLWQGRPDWRVLARRSFHVLKLALYFGLLVAWVVQSSLAAGDTAAETALDAGRALGLSLVPLALIAAYAWMVARMTVYTVTDRRVAMRVGVALPMTINLPLAQLGRADMNRRADGSGDIALGLVDSGRVSYVLMWPHVRPWRFARAEPMLRGLRDVVPAAQVLARALAASADMPAPVLAASAGVKRPAPHVIASA